MKHLVIDLQGPMAAFSSFAIEKERRTDLLPSKANVLGILHACLGVERRDVHAGHAFVEGVNVLVGQAAPLDQELKPSKNQSGYVVDFHTARVTTAAPQTTPNGYIIDLDQATDDNKNTVLTKRHYLTDVAYRAVIWATEEKLNAMLEATKSPVFAPYLGRRTCTLSLPMRARIIDCGTAVEAFRDLDTFEGDQHPNPGAAVVMVTYRDDAPLATSPRALRRIHRQRKVTHYRRAHAPEPAATDA